MDRPPETLGLLLGLVKSELVRAVEQELEAQGVQLRFSQVKPVLRLRAMGPMGASELARSLCHDAGAMTRLLDQLQDKGYIQRKPAEHDRRALRIELTDRGSALARKVTACVEQVLERVLVTLDQDERRQLVDYLQRILATLRSPQDGL